jgi:tetratricopeptide (TPR) repeat protein
VKAYGTGEVAGMLGLPPHRIRAFVKAGFLDPGRGPRGEYLFTFQDLVLLRTAAELTRQDVPPRRITQALARLRSRLPSDRPLSAVRIVAAGDEIVVHEGDEPPWNPRSSQFHIDFDVRELGGGAVPRRLERSVAGDVPPTEPEHTAPDWYEAAIDLEAIDAGEAMAAYRRALAIDPAFDDARINLGRMLQERGEVTEAESCYRAVLARGEHGLAAFNLGVLLEESGRADEAIGTYERALRADPQLAEAHYNLARLFEERGDQTSAIRHFNGYRRLVRSNGA